MLAWFGVSGETGRSFGQHGVPTGSGGAHAYRRTGTDRRRLCLPAGQRANPHVSVKQGNGYASMMSHCWTGRQNRLMRIQSRTCGMNSKLLPTVANRELQLSSGMLYKRRGSRFQPRVSGTWQKVFRDVWTQSGGREAGTLGTEELVKGFNFPSRY